MSGRDRQSENSQRQIAQQQQEQMTKLLAASEAQTAKMNEYQKPMVSFYQGLQSSDPTTRMIAGSIPLGNIAAGQKAAEQNIFEQVPEGPARDFALSQAKRQGAGQKYGTMNDLFLQSLTGLAGMGTEQGAFGMQQLAAGSRFGEAAASGQQALSQQAAQRKAATMGAIGQLASIGGSIATGGLSSMGGAAKGAAAPSWSAVSSLPNPSSITGINYQNYPAWK